ncbi:MAG: chemotaxis protein CheX [Thermodesulfobacteriota bacterium]|nr:chemotaxis protein CheX [Thermodesulfobacteriota bacterium]
MDVTLINPFINATLKVLEMMAFVKATHGRPFLKKDNKLIGDVTGVIGITGEATGTLSISFDETAILSIISSMFGEAMTEVNQEAADAVGEITNMVSGQARKELEEAGKYLQAAIPSVVTGKNHTLIQIVEGPKIAIPFDLLDNKGSFTIEVCLKTKN